MYDTERLSVGSRQFVRDGQAVGDLHGHIGREFAREGLPPLAADLQRRGQRNSFDVLHRQIEAVLVLSPAEQPNDVFVAQGPG